MRLIILGLAAGFSLLGAQMAHQEITKSAAESIEEKAAPGFKVPQTQRTVSPNSEVGMEDFITLFTNLFPEEGALKVLSSLNHPSNEYTTYSYAIVLVIPLILLAFWSSVIWKKDKLALVFVVVSALIALYVCFIYIHHHP